MLKLPSLDLVFSSNRGERENPVGAHTSDGAHPASSTPSGQHIPKTLPNKGLQNANILCTLYLDLCLLAVFMVNILFPFINECLLCFLPASPLLGSPLSRSRHSSSQSDLTGPPGASSGLSFTACMSDFSLYVFHPYGAGKQKSAVTGLPPGSGPLGMERGKQTLVVLDYGK